MNRTITLDQAEAAWTILVEECGCRHDLHDRSAFFRYVTDPRDRNQEWRFIGALGAGGKFRNNGNHDNTPYVDCYPENLTSEREQMVQRANNRLTELFKEGGE